jgi:hypothetical protein
MNHGSIFEDVQELSFHSPMTTSLLSQFTPVRRPGQRIKVHLDLFDSADHVDHILHEGLGDHAQFSVAFVEVCGGARHNIDDHIHIKSF